MGLIPDDTIAEIRARADIVAVIGRHVELKKAGRNHKGLCPFHQEKSPSFNVNSDKGFYYCFGCQQKGDVFSFVMEFEGKSFVEAAESLAHMMGILIPENNATPESTALRRSEKSKMFEINALASEFYRGQLLGAGGDRARDYLDGRGIKEDQSEAFSLGFAPAEWRALGDFLEARGADLRVAEQVGLVIKQPKKSGYYDRFRDRLMCPIFQTNGDIVGFSGRLLTTGPEAEKAGAKYINSPESAIYKKSKLLYGILQARDAFRSEQHAILVEGNFDVVRLHQNGFQQVVAPLGTALTESQALQLKRLTGQVCLLYDGDRAGRAATLKGLQTLLSQEVSVKIASLPHGEDPDSLIGKEGPEALRKILARAQPAVEYFIHEVWVRADRSDEGRAKTLQESAQVLKYIKDPTQRDFAIGTFASALGVDEATLRRGLRRAFQQAREKESRLRPGDAENSPTQNAPQRSQKPPPRLQLAIICILAEFPELLSVAEEGNVFSYLSDTRLREMYEAAREGQPMISVTSDPGIAKALLSGAYSAVENPSHTLEESITSLKRDERTRRLSELQVQVEEAGRRKDSELERQLVSEIIAIRKQVD